MDGSKRQVQSSEDVGEFALVVVSPGAAPEPRFGRVRQSARLLDALIRELDSGDYDEGLDAITDMREAAHKMVMALPGMSPWNELVGPFYSAPDTAALLQITAPRLAELTESQRVLATPTDDGINLYPSFQFADDGSPTPDLQRALQVMDPDNLDPWYTARWLNRWSETLMGRPVDLLRAGRVDAVIDRATRSYLPFRR